jgi:hypothetical protein
MNELEKFRIRWNRWLGQKCRKDKPYWATLLNSNWLGWATKVLLKNDISTSNLVAACLDNRINVKKYFAIAIQYADMQDLYALDSLYCQDKIEGE